MSPQSIDALGRSGLCLRAEFIWIGDRYQHIVSSIHADGQSLPLLESVEGTPSDDWPASPPLQNQSAMKLPDGRAVALLVGMAGGSHWSASVEPVPAEAALLFDLACRHSKPPAWLGSRYRWLSDKREHVTIRSDGAIIVQDEKIVEIQAATTVDAIGTTRWKFIVRVASAAH